MRTKQFIKNGCQILRKIGTDWLENFKHRLIYGPRLIYFPLLFLSLINFIFCCGTLYYLYQTSTFNFSSSSTTYFFTQFEHLKIPLGINLALLTLYFAQLTIFKRSWQADKNEWKSRLSSEIKNPYLKFFFEMRSQEIFEFVKKWNYELNEKNFREFQQIFKNNHYSIEKAVENFYLFYRSPLYWVNDILYSYQDLKSFIDACFNEIFLSEATFLEWKRQIKEDVHQKLMTHDIHYKKEYELWIEIDFLLKELSILIDVARLVDNFHTNKELHENDFFINLLNLKNQILNSFTFTFSDGNNNNVNIVQSAVDRFLNNFERTNNVPLTIEFFRTLQPSVEQIRIKISRV